MNNIASVSYLAPPAIASGIAIVLLAIVLCHDYRSHTNRIFSLLVFVIGIWGILIFGMRASPNTTYALLWDRALIPVPVAMLIFYYHFSLVITKTRKQKNLLRFAYIILTLLIVLSPTRLFVTRMDVQPFGYAPIFTNNIIPVFLFGFFLVVMGLYNLAKGYQNATTYEERNRVLLIMIAMVFPILGSIIDVFATIFPASIFGNIAFCLITAVAILKYHLLDIRVVFRKSLAYLLTSSIVAIPYATMLVVLSYTIRAEVQPWWVHGTVILLLAIVLRPLHSWAQKLVDRLFYRDRYDSLTALVRFSQESHSVTKLKELGATIVELVSSALRASTVSLLLRSKARTGFVVGSSLGFENPPSLVMLRESSPLVKWLERHGDILSSTQLNTVPQLQSLSGTEKNNVERLGAELYVPIATNHGQLSGILVLGRKLSEQSYSPEDKQLLAVVSTQMGMALDNARLYEETRESEKALRESKEKLRLVFDSVTEGIAVFDLNGNIVEVNEAVLRMHGYNEKGELNGRSALELIAKKDRTRAMANLKRTLKYGYIKNTGHTLLRRDRSEFPAELSSAILRDTSGNPEGFVTVTQDISGRKEAEQKERQLQQEVQLSRRLASIGELASGVAHEINNPLTGILGFSKRLLRKSSDGTTKRDLERIYSEATRVAKVVGNLRTFACRREPHKECLNINDILQKALEMRIYEFKTNNVEVVTKLESNLPPAMVDFQQIQQVFLNVILNAEQAMTEAKHGGKLVIKTYEEAGYITITFIDDGPGIPAENLDMLFDPFFTTRGDIGGTGLGLSISYGIVTEHGGRIFVRSKLRKGSTFFVELPLST